MASLVTTADVTPPPGLRTRPGRLFLRVVLRAALAAYFVMTVIVSVWLAMPKVFTGAPLAAALALALPVTCLGILAVSEAAPHRAVLIAQLLTAPALSLLVVAEGHPDSVVVLLYLWGPPYAFAVVGRRFGILQSALVGLCYGAAVLTLLRLHPDLRGDARRDLGIWLLTVSTVVLCGILTDRLTASARRATESFRRGFDQSVVGTVIVDADLRVVEVNRAFGSMIARSPAQIVGRRLTDFVTADDIDVAEAQLTQYVGQAPPRVELHLRRADGAVVLAETDAVVVRTDAVSHLLYCQFRDVTEAREAHAMLARQAMTDTLTGLPNRAALNERIRGAMLHRQRTGNGFAVMVLDLDRFKIINDSFGHRAGDELLVAVADRLVAVSRDVGMVARLGGDEFVVVCEDIDGPAAATALAERLLTTVSAATCLRDLEVTISTSVGVALAGPRSTRAAGYSVSLDPDDLVRHADMAMYQAKRRGGNTAAVFDEALRDVSLQRLRIEMELRQAVRAGQLEVHYQPVVDLATGVWTGLEALVRWRHPERGLLWPGEFISVAEESDLIDELGSFVLRSGIAELQALRENRPELRGMHLAVNVSVRQLAHPGFAADLFSTAAAAGLPCDRLAVEITESLLMGDVDLPGSNSVALTELEELRRGGVRVLVDDFGTGFSSLSYLRRLPVDAVKVDRSFVSGVGRSLQDPAIVTAIVDLARALRLDVVAEGVESDEQWAGLRRLGCTHGQGYLFGRAMDIAEVGRRAVTAPALPVDPPVPRPRARRPATARRIPAARNDGVTPAPH